MRKLLRKLAKWYLRKTCSHKFKNIEYQPLDFYYVDKCKKCGTIKSGELL